MGGDLFRFLFVQQFLQVGENQIRQTKPAAYQVAGNYLRRMRDLLAETGRGEEWTELLSSIQDTHRRKRRLMELLDRLEGKEHRILS